MHREDEKEREENLDSLIIHDDVGQPYIFRGHVQHLDAAILLGVPAKLVIEPFLRRRRERTRDSEKLIIICIRQGEKISSASGALLRFARGFCV